VLWLFITVTKGKGNGSHQKQVADQSCKATKDDENFLCMHTLIVWGSVQVLMAKTPVVILSPQGARVFPQSTQDMHMKLWFTQHLGVDAA